MSELTELREKVEKLEQLMRVQQSSLEQLHQHLEAMRPAVESLCKIFLTAKTHQQAGQGGGPGAN